jgi:hypothetical protein
MTLTAVVIEYSIVVSSTACIAPEASKYKTSVIYSKSENTDYVWIAFYKASNCSDQNDLIFGDTGIIFNFFFEGEGEYSVLSSV